MIDLAVSARDEEDIRGEPSAGEWNATFRTR